MTTNTQFPKRGEIWLVNFEPTVGSEMKKIRPAVIISSDTVGKLPIKLVATITGWKPYFAQYLEAIALLINFQRAIATSFQIKGDRSFYPTR